MLDVLFRGWPVPFAARRFTPVLYSCSTAFFTLFMLPSVAQERPDISAEKCERPPKATALPCGNHAIRKCISRMNEPSRGHFPTPIKHVFSSIFALKSHAVLRYGFFVASRPFFKLWERSCEPPRTSFGERTAKASSAGGLIIYQIMARGTARWGFESVALVRTAAADRSPLVHRRTAWVHLRRGGFSY